MRALSAIVLLSACITAGYGEGAEAERIFTNADAARIASVEPVTPDWPAWPGTPASEDREGSEAATKWVDDDKLANLVVDVSPTAASAHQRFDGFNAQTREWSRETRTILRDEAVDDLGDEAWVFWIGGGGAQTTYHWREENLLLEAHIHCYGDCPSDVDAAARAWADAVAREAASNT